MNEKAKKEYSTERLNQELLGTLGEKNQARTKYASPWKETVPAENTSKNRKKKRKNSRDRYFLLLSIGIAIGVMTAAGLLIYGSLLFLH